LKRFNRKIAAIVLAAGTLVKTIHADLITGNVSFVGLITLDSNSVATATSVVSWTDPSVEETHGTFASGPYALPDGAAAAFKSQIWGFNSTAPSTYFWSVGGFNFEMLASYVVVQTGTPGFNGFVYVNGTGIVSGNGFVPTACLWRFSTSDPPADPTTPSWTFEASVDCLNSNGAPVLASTTISNVTILSWSDPTFALQSAPLANGTFTNVPGATSPYTNCMADTQQFFRLMQP
jgi:hypothetical protein